MSGTGRVSRRQFLGAAGGALAASALGLGGCAGSGRQEEGAHLLYIQNWADYVDPDVIPQFEKRYGIKVIYDTYASNEGLLAKMQAGASNYDLVVPSGYTLRVLKRMNLLAPIEKERLPNLKNLMPRFQNPAFDPHGEYSVAYMWGSTGIGYSQKAFAGAEPRDWDVFWDKRVAERITLLDDARETLGMALKRRGHSYNTVEEPPIEEATRDLIAEKELVMAYTSDQVIIHLASGDSLASLVYSGDCYQATRSNPDVKYVIPASGTSIWIDSWCIPRQAPHVDNAYKFVNFMLEPEIAAQNANFVHYASPNEASLKWIEPELAGDPNVYPPETVLARCEEIGDIGPAMFVYDRLWTELKCA